MKRKKHVPNRILKLRRGLMLLASMMALSVQAVVTVAPGEMAQKSRWVQEHLLTASNLPPFSFAYNSQSSSILLPSWKRVGTVVVLDPNRTQHVIIWTNTFLQVKCVVAEYHDYPMVEWTVYFKGIGPRSTPILENIQGLDTTFSRTNYPKFVLHGNKGDYNTADSYEPFQITLPPSSVQNYAPPAYSGKSCDGPNGWPYYNLQMPDGGVVLAIGWPGQWASSFSRDAGNDLRIQAGQQLTHLVLNPGEEIRTPLIAMLFWRGTNVVRAQNIWRHWYLAHEIPRINGEATPPLVAEVGDNTNIINACLQAGIRPDILWRDADTEPYTWYPTANGPYTGNISWLNTGTWEVDTNYYPNGFGGLSAALHSMGMKFLLWFEPERVGDPNSWLAINHPEWLLHPGSVGLILDEGNPVAFNWLTNHINGMIISNGIDWYREDMNGDGPCTSWRANDATNRQGITENFYVQGHLAYWDALLAMNTGLRIDSCASGGRRNDLESMRRAVPLHRSDFSTSPVVVDGNQCQTYGLSSWLPYQGQGCGFWDSPYSFRSFYMAAFALGINGPSAAAQTKAYKECKKIAPIMLNGDYYPLTSYSLANNVWIAWQFDWPDKGEGCAQAFRRINSEVPAMTFKLCGLVPGKLYAVQDFDKGDLGSYTGSALMSTGLTVSLGSRQSALLYYTNVQAIKLSASGTSSSGLKPLAVQFSVTGISATGSAVAYDWDFGDGATSTNQNPSHIYVAGGRYHARVTASDGLGNTNTMEVPVTVLSKTSRLMKATFTGCTNAEVLTNFPVLMVFGPNLSANGFAYSQMASTNGWDLVFMNSNATQTLNYEIEKWNTNGSSYVWVQVPQLISNACILAYWGDSNLVSAPAACATNGAVWNNGYVSIWHFGETAGDPRDSTSNGVKGSVNTTYGSMNQSVSGEIGDGCSFSGGYISASGTALPPGASPRTFSAWFEKSPSRIAFPGQEMVGYGDNSTPGDRFGLWIGGNFSVPNTLGVESQGAARTFAWAGDFGWHCLAAVLPAGQNDLSEVALYYDGTENTSATGSGTIDTIQDELCFATIPGYHTRDSTYDFDGTLDEVRISDVARSADWLWAEYMTIASNWMFCSYGVVMSSANLVSSVWLTISHTNDTVLVSWPKDIATGAVLKESPDLHTWTDSIATIVTNGSHNSAIIEPKGAVKFYRLTL